MDILHNLIICLPRTGNEGGGCSQIPFVLHIYFWSQNKTSSLAPIFQIFRYQHILLFLSPGDKTRSLLASALKIRTIIYMHILPSLTRCVDEQWRRYCRQELPICALDCLFLLQSWRCCRLLDKILIKTLDFF